MNQDPSQNPRQTLESSLTALLLGELPPDHATALRELLAHDPELAKLHDRLKSALELVQETEAPSVAEPVSRQVPFKLSDDRRQKLLQQFKTVAPKQFAKPARPIRAWLVPAGIAAAVVVILGVGVLFLSPEMKLESRLGRDSLASLAPSEAKVTEDRDSEGRSNLHSVEGVGYIYGPNVQQPKETRALQVEEKSLGRKLSEPSPREKIVSEPPRYPIGQPLAQNTTGVAERDKKVDHNGALAQIVLPSVNESSESEKKPEQGGRLGEQLTVIESLARNKPVAAPGIAAGGYGGVVAPGPTLPAQNTSSAATVAPEPTLTVTEPTTGLPVAGVTAALSESQTVAGKPATPVVGDLPPVGRLFRSDFTNYGTIVVTDDSPSPGLLAFSTPSAAKQELSYSSATPATPPPPSSINQPKAGSELKTYSLDNSGLFAFTPPDSAKPQIAASEQPATAETLSASAFKGTPKDLRLGSVAQSDLEKEKLAELEGRLSAAGSQKTQEPSKIDEAKALLDGGKTKEAESALRDVVKTDPQNQAAYYYLNQIHESQYKDSLARREAASRQALAKIEDAWKTPPVSGSATTTPQKPRNESRALGFDWYLGNALVATNAAQNERLLADNMHLKNGDVLGFGGTSQRLASPKDEFRNSGELDFRRRYAQTPLPESAVNESVVRQARGKAAAGRVTKLPDNAAQGERVPLDIINSNGADVSSLETRTFHLDPKAFSDGLKAIESIDFSTILQPTSGSTAGGVTGGGIGGQAVHEGPRIMTITNVSGKAQEELRAFYKVMGVDLGSQLGKTMSFDDREGKLVVRATKEDFEIIEAANNVLAPSAATPAQTGTNLIQISRAKNILYTKLDRIRLGEVKYAGLPLSEVIAHLTDQAKKGDPEKRGINFILNQSSPHVDLGQIAINLNPPLTDVRLMDLLDAIVKTADTPIKYSVEDYGIVFSPRETKNNADQPKEPPTKPPAPIPQPEIQTTENAFSTFSLNVSDVSFKLAAASLEKGVLPDPSTIRSEEFLNAFDYRDPEAPPGVPIAFAWERARYPFAQNRDLLRFSLKTAAQGRQPGRPLNLVLLLDNSGSMERADRVSIIREALRVLAAQLQAQDTFSVVTFSRTARLWVDGVRGNQAAQVADEISKLTPQGGTNLEEAMNLAYQTALKHYIANGINRVVLLTDGAANLGNVEPDALKQKVESHRKQGIALDCFGIGWEGFNDDLLEMLSRNGDGRYGFINTPEEAATEFAGQLAGALRVAASDVKVQVEFNPKRVTAYRQIGYAKHQLTKQQFRDNTVDAAEIGAAESGNALYIIDTNPTGEGPLAVVRVRYKLPGTAEYHEHEWAVPYTGNAVALDQATPAMRLAATASAFSEWLASSPYATEVTLDKLLGYLSGVPEVYGADTRPRKLEWMLRQAKSLAGK